MATYEEIEALADKVDIYIRPFLYVEPFVNVIEPGRNAYGLNDKAMRLLGKYPDVSNEWRLEVGVREHRRMTEKGIEEYPAGYAWITVTNNGQLLNEDRVIYECWKSVPDTAFSGKRMSRDEFQEKYDAGEFDNLKGWWSYE